VVAARSTAPRGGKSNWLLRGLVFASLGVHVFLLGHLAALYKSDATSYIELELRTEEKPPKTVLAPPQEEKPKPPPVRPVVKKPLPRPAEKPIDPPIEPSVTAALPSVVEPIAMPRISEPPASVRHPGPPAQAGPAVETASTSPPSPYGAAGDYLGMVRKRIENHKRYPYAARRRQIEGRVVVRFVIEPDGSASHVTLVGKSRHRLLNEAALASIRESAPFPKPPAQLFSGPVSLEVSVVFELI